MSTKTKPWSRHRARERHRHGGPRTTVADVPMAPEYDRMLQCAKKKPYFSAEVAHRVAARLNDRNLNGDGEPEFAYQSVRPYTCPHCGSIHVGRFSDKDHVGLTD